MFIFQTNCLDHLWNTEKKTNSQPDKKGKPKDLKQSKSWWIKSVKSVGNDRSKGI